MKAIYTRTIGVYDGKLGDAMEISKGLAKVRKKHYPDHEVYFSFQIGGNPRTVSCLLYTSPSPRDVP